MWKISQKGGGRNRAGVPRWYPRTSRAALRGVWWLLAAGRVVMARRVSRGKRFTIRDRPEPKLPPGSNLRTKSCLEQIHGASYLPPRTSVGTILRSPGFSAALVGTRQRFSRYLSWRVVARRWNFALAFGGVSKYTSTSTLVEGEDIRERL